MAKEYLTQGSGERLKRIIDELNLSGAQFAQVCGYTTAYIYSIVNGKRGLLRSVAEKVVSAYGVNMQWLENGEGEMFRPERWSEKGAIGEEQETSAQRLREVCSASGLVQVDFCKRLKCSTSTLQQFLSGKKKVTLSFAKRIEAEYNVGADWLLYGNEKNREFPCSDKMIAFLKEHPEKREIIWNWMNENSGQN